MKIPQFFNDDSDEEDQKEKIKEKKINPKYKIPLPFLKIKLDKKNKRFPFLPRKVENAKGIIDSHTDKLLIEGFEGNEVDFNKCYNKAEPNKLKNVLNVKTRKMNKFLIKDGYSGPMKLTKTKEFKLSPKKKDKLLSKLKLNNNKIKYTSINLKYSKINKFYFNNNIYGNNSTTKSLHLNNNNNSISEYNPYNISGSNTINFLLDKSDSNTINRNYGNTFYFYKKNIESQIQNAKRLKNRSISLNDFLTLRDILNDTSNNVSDINQKLKLYIKKNNIKSLSSNTTKNSNKTNRLYNFMKDEDDKIRTTLESLQNKKDKNNEKFLKLIKKDEGINSQNIWIKRTTANLISFGKSFINLDDNHFYQERKRIMEDYPKFEKEANVNSEEREINNNNDELKQYIIKMDKNSRKMNDLNNMTISILHKLKNKLKEMKKNK